MNIKENIKFNYKYRDAGNYKVYGHVIFANPDGLTIELIEEKLRASLIDSEFFDAILWNLPYLKFNDVISDLDHTWNEYECVDYTSELPTQQKTVTDFLELVRAVSDVGSLRPVRH